MSTLSKRQENREKGEILTQGLLANDFWILKRPVDVDGADFLVQNTAETLRELRDRTKGIETLGIIQAKYFEKSNMVQIEKTYVLDDGEARNEFFCFIHTHGEDGEHIYYFFSASEIANTFYESKCGKFYRFKITKSRDYSNFKNIKQNIISKKIKLGILSTTTAKNINYMRKQFKIYATPTLYYDEKPDFLYHFKVIENVHIVICTQRGSSAHLLEMRRDLFPNQGGFFWGGNGTGPTFLATSLLAHHFNGKEVKKEDINSLVKNLLQKLDRDKEYKITTHELVQTISKKMSRREFMKELETEWLGRSNENGFEIVEVLERNGHLVRVKCHMGEEFDLEVDINYNNYEHIDYSLHQIATSTDVKKPILFNFAYIERDIFDYKVTDIALSAYYRLYND